jgi:2-furoyl-CoA dehydrogenase large subunit
MNTSSAGQDHETLVATVLVEALERDPDTIRVVHTDSLNALLSNSPVGSRMVIMLGGAAAGAARKIKVALLAIAAHTPNTGIAELEYDVASVSVKGDANQKLGWDQLQRQWITQKPLVQRIPDSDCAGVTGNWLRQAP